MTVRPVASTPAVTCSAVDPEPNPLAPAFPVMSDKMPISNHAAKKPPNSRSNTAPPQPQNPNKNTQRSSATATQLNSPPPPPPLPNKKSPKRTRQEALTLAGQIDELFNARAREAGARWKGRRRWLFMVGGAGAELVAELESMQEGLGRRRDRKEFGIVTERIESTWIHPNFKRILYVWVL